ncbi:MAG: DUF86 domain-containing protein [DPANN group archaeon]|nr:DUF86 domain-containing protein [DPANN group archaeon]
MTRIKEKLQQIREFLAQFRGIRPKSLEEYSTNIEKKAACERFVEKIVEGTVDVAFLVIKRKRFEIPEDDIDAFTILLDNHIIDRTLAQRLKQAKGMRNIIVHEYGKIDDSIIFRSITDELEKDVRSFLKRIEQLGL